MSDKHEQDKQSKDGLSHEGNESGWEPWQLTAYVFGDLDAAMTEAIGSRS